MHDFISKALGPGYALLFLILFPKLLNAGADISINSDAPGTVQNEIRITQNPTDSNNFLVAYNDSAGTASSPLGVSFSLDGGMGWTDLQLGVPIHPILGGPDDGITLPVIFDPFLGSDSQGNLYAGYIATDGSLGGPGGIYIERSVDKGQTWSGPINIDFNTRSLGPMDPSYRFNDRPDMTVDSSDNLHVIWIKDVGVGLPTSDIYYSKSPPPPTGLDFTGFSPNSIAPKTLNDFPNGMDQANAPDVVVAPNGTVYAAWIEVNVTNPNPKPGQLMFDFSLNGGLTFGMDIVAQNILALPRHLATSAGAGSGDDARSGSYPVIGVDPNNSQTVYMAFAADPAGPGGMTGADEADIFFIKSIDGGFTWSMPIRVNDDTTTTDQFHPVMAVKPNGIIDLAWYDKRNSAADAGWDVYFTNSTDGGTSFAANRRITDQSFSTPTNAPGTEPWLGEYLGLVVDSTLAYIAFTSGINDSRGDVFFDSIANTIPPVQEPGPPEIPSRCGDGMQDEDETCDDGNLNDGDGCSGTCTLETLAQVPALSGSGCQSNLLGASGPPRAFMVLVFSGLGGMGLSRVLRKWSPFTGVGRRRS